MSLPERIIHGRYRVIYAVNEQADVVVSYCRDDQSGSLVYVAEWPQASDTLIAVLDRLQGVHHAALLEITHHGAREQGGYIAVCQAPSGRDIMQTIQMRGGPLSQSEIYTQLSRLLDLLGQLHSLTPPLYAGAPTPADIIVMDDGRWMLMPFCVGRAVPTTTTAYMAGELHQGRQPNAASDVYAIAAIAYFAATGMPPVSAAQQATGAQFVPPRRHNPQLSEMFEIILLRALQEKVVNRYQGVAEMRVSLDTMDILGNREVGLPDAATPINKPIPATNDVAEGMLPGNYTADTPTTSTQTTKSTLSLGCLAAVAIVLTIIAIALCVILLLVYPGSPFRSLWSGVFPSFNAAATSTPEPSANNAIVAATPTAIPALTKSNIAIDATNATELQASSVITNTSFGPVAWSPDGQLIAISAGDVITIHEQENFNELARLRGHLGNVTSLSWSPDSRYLASGASNDTVIHVWDVNTGIEAYALRGHDGWIRNVSFSPDGNKLASGATDLEIRIWDLTSQRTIHTLTGHTDLIGGLAWSPDNSQLASASRDGSVRKWQVADGSAVADFAFETPINPNMPGEERYWATGLIWTPDGEQLIVGATDGNITVIRATSGDTVRTLSGHESWVTIRGLQLSNDGKTLYSSGLDGRINVWDMATGTNKAQYTQHQLGIFGISLDPQQMRLISTSDQEGKLLVWDLDAQQISTLRTGLGVPVHVCYTEDGTVQAITGYNGLIRLTQDDDDGSLYVNSVEGVMQGVAFLGLNRFALIATQDTVNLYTPESQTPRPLAGLQGRPQAIATTRDGSYLIVGTSTNLQVWRGDNPTEPINFATTLQNIVSIDVSNDGTRMVVHSIGENAGYEVWDLGTRSRIFAHTETLVSAHLLANGSQVAVLLPDATIQIRELASSSPTQTISMGDTGNGYIELTTMPNTDLLVTADLNGLVSFIDSDGQTVHQVDANDGVTSIAVNNQGSEIAVGRRDGSIMRFALP
jgi:WD40 repeat protein